MTAPLRRQLPSLSWLTLALMAAVMAYADGFWMVSLEGAVGAVGQAEDPFSTWLRDSTLLLPLFVGAVAVTLAFARRRMGALRGAGRVVAAGLLVAVTGTVVGTAALGARSLYNYSIQSREIGASHAQHHLNHAAAEGAATESCDLLCQLRRDTAATHVHGVEITTVALAVTNVVLVGWVLALRGGELDP